MSDENNRQCMIRTYTGKWVKPDALRPEDVSIVDIAHHLALTCRFNGACREFYSVAQHCLVVASMLPPELQLWGLLHDAAEAYIGDIVRPLKSRLLIVDDVDQMGPRKWLSAKEAEILEVIISRFGLQMPIPQEVEAADNIALAMEMRDLLLDAPSLVDLGLPPPMKSRIEPASCWRVVRASFLNEVQRCFLGTMFQVPNDEPDAVEATR